MTPRSLAGKFTIYGSPNLTTRVLISVKLWAFYAAKQHRTLIMCGGAKPVRVADAAGNDNPRHG